MVKQQVFYKYKSLDNFEYLLDIILKERLYAALHDELNDPMEGVVKIDGTIPKDKEQEWEDLIKTFRIVCFSRNKDHPLMWSHYADGARGCAVEFELMAEQQVHRVSYLKKPIITESYITREKAKEILVYKEKPWKYESESRCLLGNNEKFLPIQIKSVTFGSRAEKSKVDMLLHVLSLCKPDLKVFVLGEQNLVNGIKITVARKRAFVCDRIRTQDYCPQCTEVKMTQDDYVLRHRGWGSS